MNYFKLEEVKKIYLDKAIYGLMEQTMFNASEGRIKGAAEAIYAKEQGRFYVAESQGEVVGILGVRRVDNAFVEIMHFVVKEDLRKQGIGKGLIDCVINCERVDEIIVSCDEKLISYYRAAGFACKETEDPITNQLTYKCSLKLD